ncbi:MAG: NAD(P)/FAD-dependent oxidoreductase [Luteolibacter sp.]
MPPPQKSIAIIGGGAAGFFTAITAAEADPTARVTIYERTKNYLSKVKISGGGRCNVTHSCFDPTELSKKYPRGSRELRGAFHKFQPLDTIAWFEKRGVPLKTEPDGRMFPETNTSQTIIDCFLKAARNAGIILRPETGIQDITKTENTFHLTLTDGSTATADKLCITTGSLKASPLTRSIKALGHTIEPLVPSLFAFNLTDPRTTDLSGLAVQNATVRTIPKGKPQTGPILITHRGLSGPAILRLSAWEARHFQQHDYTVEIAINWLGTTTETQLRDTLSQLRAHSGKSLVKTKIPGEIPRRLWERILHHTGIKPETQLSQLPKPLETKLIQELTDARFQVKGKTTNKDEFVTCGGIRLKEVDLRTMESKLIPGLHFAGECLDIDGITGGFNFQAAWTTAHLAGNAMA